MFSKGLSEILNVKTICELPMLKRKGVDSSTR